MKTPKNVSTEFQEFLSLSPEAPPAELSARVTRRVTQELNPAPARVFLHFILVHLIMGALTLLWCPQLGLSPLGIDGVGALYMSLGEHGCTLACAMTFLGVSALVGSLILNRDEARVLRRYRWTELLLTSIITLGLFGVMGAHLEAVTVMVWLMGAILGGVLGLESGRVLRASTG